jgi:hypothetical protein
VPWSPNKRLFGPQEGTEKSGKVCGVANYDGHLRRHVRHARNAKHVRRVRPTQAKLATLMPPEACLVGEAAAMAAGLRSSMKQHIAECETQFAQYDGKLDHIIQMIDSTTPVV